MSREECESTPALRECQPAALADESERAVWSWVAVGALVSLALGILAAVLAA